MIVRYFILDYIHTDRGYLTIRWCFGSKDLAIIIRRVIILEITHVRFIVTSSNSYAYPALGIKANAYPRRLNKASALINREDIF